MPGCCVRRTGDAAPSAAGCCAAAASEAASVSISSVVTRSLAAARPRCRTTCHGARTDGFARCRPANWISGSNRMARALAGNAGAASTSGRSSMKTSHSKRTRARDLGAWSARRDFLEPDLVGRKTAVLQPLPRRRNPARPHACHASGPGKRRTGLVADDEEIDVPRRAGPRRTRQSRDRAAPVPCPAP